jgi:hypothetical protein
MSSDEYYARAREEFFKTKLGESKIKELRAQILKQCKELELPLWKCFCDKPSELKKKHLLQCLLTLHKYKVVDITIQQGFKLLVHQTL